MRPPPTSNNAARRATQAYLHNCNLTLFSLPAEIRNRIYEYVLGGQEFHIAGHAKTHISEGSSAVYMLCPYPRWWPEAYKLSKGPNPEQEAVAGFPQLLSGRKPHFCERPFDVLCQSPCACSHCCKSFGPHPNCPRKTLTGINLDLLYVCRQIYAECALTPFGFNVFVLESLVTAHDIHYDLRMEIENIDLGDDASSFNWWQILDFFPRVKRLRVFATYERVLRCLATNSVKKPFHRVEAIVGKEHRPELIPLCLPDSTWETRQKLAELIEDWMVGRIGWREGRALLSESSTSDRLRRYLLGAPPVTNQTWLTNTMLSEQESREDTAKSLQIWTESSIQPDFMEEGQVTYVPF